MPRPIRYRQCLLVKQLDARSRTELVTFIPEQFAQLNRVVGIRDTDGDWKPGWQVKAVGQACQEQQLPNVHTATKAHPRATGDSSRPAQH